MKRIGTSLLAGQRSRGGRNDTYGVGSAWGAVSVSRADPFPQAALRTGRASCPASGSPRACRRSSADQGLEALELLCGVAVEATLLPRRGDLRSAVAVVDDLYRARVEEHRFAVGWPPSQEIAA